MDVASGAHNCPDPDSRQGGISGSVPVAFLGRTTAGSALPAAVYRFRHHTIHSGCGSPVASNGPLPPLAAARPWATSPPSGWEPWHTAVLPGTAPAAVPGSVPRIPVDVGSVASDGPLPPRWRRPGFGPQVHRRGGNRGTVSHQARWRRRWGSPCHESRVGVGSVASTGHFPTGSSTPGLPCHESHSGCRILASDGALSPAGGGRLRAASPPSRWEPWHTTVPTEPRRRRAPASVPRSPHWMWDSWHLAGLLPGASGCVPRIHSGCGNCSTQR